MHSSPYPYLATTLSIANIPSPSPISSLASFDSDVSDSIIQTNTTSNIRQCLNNILLTLFRHHPSGVLASELPILYYQTCGELLFLNNDLKYLLRTHFAIHITKTQKRGILYTLTSSEISNVLQLFSPLIMKQYIGEHVLRLLNIFPHGIASICFEETLHNISQFFISKVIPSWNTFVSSIPFVVCLSVGNHTVFINTLNMNAMDHLDPTKALANPIGYQHLFKSLSNNTTSLNVSELEKLFELHFKFKINSEAPLISSIVSKMNAVTDIKCVLHNKSPFIEDHCSVFMGGFKHKTSTADIRRELIAMGFVVIECTEIKYRKFGFSWVTLSSSDEADYLMKMSPIKMLGVNIDVRPYINREKQQKHKPDEQVILDVMIELLSLVNEGLSIREIQPLLYERFAYRISGTHLVDIIKKNKDCLRIKTDESNTERILYICR